MLSNDIAKAKVIGTYKDLITRLYCTIRFRIMNMRILEEIGQYIPQDGHILDIGCGFGLFSLFYALRSAGRHITAFDLNPQRINMARTAAHDLELDDRVHFHVQDAVKMTVTGTTYDAVYMLDILHHVPITTHAQLIQIVYDVLAPGGILLLKDIDVRPWYKMAFTWLLDVLMSPSSPPNYIARRDMYTMLEDAGFDVKSHALLDILPYPHVMYICRKVHPS